MADTQFQAVINLVDRASMPLLGLAARLETVNRGIEASNAQSAASFSGMRYAATQVGEQLGRLGQNTGLARLALATRTLGGEMHGLARRASGLVTSVITPLAGLSAVGSVAGLIGIVHSSVEAAGKMEDLMLMTSETAGSLGQLRFAAAMVGTDFEGSAIPALNKLTLSIEEARNGSAEMGDTFRAMGISVRSMADQSSTEIFGRISDSFARVQARVDAGQVSAARAQQFYARMARTVMGRGGIEEIKMLREFREHQAEMARLGALANRRDANGGLLPTVTSAERAEMDKLGDTLTAIGLMVGGIKTAIGRELAPLFLPMAEDLRDYLAANREVIASGFRDFMRDVRDYVRDTNWIATAQGARDFARDVRSLVTDLGGLKGIAIGLSAVLGVQLVASLAASAQALWGVAAAVTAVSTPILLIAGAVTTLALAIPKLREANREAAANPRAMPLAPPRAGSLRGGARVIEGWDEPDSPADPYSPWWQRLAPGLTPSGPGPGGHRGGLNGRAPIYPQDSSVTVRFENVPPGTRITSDSTGPGAPNLDVGYAFP